MATFFGKKSRTNRLNAMSQAPAHRTPTGVMETLQTSFGENFLNATSISITLDRNRARGELQQRASEISGISPNFNESNARKRDEDFRKRYQAWRKDNPDGPSFPVTEENINAIIRERRQARRDASERAALGEQGFVSGAARFLGGTAGFMADPINLLSMGVAGTARSVLGTVVKQAGIGAGAEVPIQSIVQGQRPGIGEQPSLAEAAVAVGSAAVGAGVLGGGIAAGARGLRRLRARKQVREEALPQALIPDFRAQEVKDAEQILQYLEDLEARNPFPDTPAGRAQHHERLQQMYSALQDGRSLNEAFKTSPYINRETVVKAREGEKVSEFMDRVRKRDPELFDRLDKIDQDIAAIKRGDEVTLEKVTRIQPEEPDTIRALRRQLTETTDKRKIKRLERKIRQAGGQVRDPRNASVRRALSLEGRDTSLVEQFDQEQQRLFTDARKAVARREAGKQTRIDEETNATNIEEFDAQLKGSTLTKADQARINSLEVEKVRLTKRVDRLLQKQDPFTKQVELQRTVVKALPDMPEGTADVAEFGAVVRALAMAKASRTSATSVQGQASRVIDDVIEESPAESQARLDTVETQINTLADIEDGTVYHVADAQGNVRTMTAKEMLDDLAEDQKLLSELESCVAGALV